MTHEDIDEHAAFRSEARRWLDANAPRFAIKDGEVLSEPELVARGRAWQQALHEGGFAGIRIPEAHGGRGGTSAQAKIFAQEEGRWRLPKGAYIGIGMSMALPVIRAHGSPEQIARFVTPTLKGQMTWCQLFSEPGAGSDLAALRTSAVRDGDDWIINGQKIWSSWAHHADWGILIARSDFKAPKHKGLTFFVVDMRTGGIDVRPIRQISGASDFNETFMDDVRIPDSDRIGAVGEGWAATMTTLMGERLGVGSEDRHGVAALIRYAAATRRGDGVALDSDAVRLSLASAYAEEMATRAFQGRLNAMAARGENPGAAAAMIKLAYSARFQKTSGLALELRGPAGIAPEAGDAETRRIQHDYIWSSAMRIAGGADEVLRNQVAERILGMPGEIRTDKTLPFDQI